MSRTRGKRDRIYGEETDLYVCICAGISELSIREAVRSGAETLESIRETLGACSGCGRCEQMLRELLESLLEVPDRQVQLLPAHPS